MKAQHFSQFLTVLIVFFFMMVGCNPLTSSTSIPLSEIDLESIVIISGDFPAGYSGSQIQAAPPEMFAAIKGYENNINQQITRNGEMAGNVSVFLFSSTEKGDAAYSSIVDGFGTSRDGLKLKTTVTELPDVGETAVYAIAKLEIFGASDTYDIADLAFKRCNAIVHIRMVDAPDADLTLAYAKKLDKRLVELTCG